MTIQHQDFVENAEFRSNTFSSRFLRFLTNNPALIILIALILLGSAVSPVFLTSRNLLNILWGISVLGLISVGQTMLMITGSFDMSVAYVVGLSGITTVMLQINGANLFVSVLGGLVSGVIIGILNGAIVILTKANAFLVTLGTSALVYSINLTLTESKTWYATIEDFLILGRGKFLDKIHYSVLLFLLLAIVTEIILRKTVLGRSLYAIGMNGLAAKYSGIMSDKIRFFIYVFCGFCAALAGLVMTARTGSTVANSGVGLEFDSLIVSVLGGTSLSGGKGGTLRTVIGVLILGVINNLLVLLNFQYEAQQIAKGLLFLIVVFFDAALESNRR